MYFVGFFGTGFGGTHSFSYLISTYSKLLLVREVPFFVFDLNLISEVILESKITRYASTLSNLLLLFKNT